jgi:hypothetical protein
VGASPIHIAGIDEWYAPAIHIAGVGDGGVGPPRLKVRHTFGRIGEVGDGSLTLPHSKSASAMICLKSRA